jgi:hypothetical protein
MLLSNLRRREFWSFRSSESSEAAGAQIAVQQQFGRDLKVILIAGSRDIFSRADRAASPLRTARLAKYALASSSFLWRAMRERLEGRPRQSRVVLAAVPPPRTHRSGQHWHETPAKQGGLL